MILEKTITDKYEPVIGLEVHIQLLTTSKIYCGDSTEFGAMPNTQVSPVSLGHPGTLPFLNEKVVEYAIRLGAACNCMFTKENQFARKNYFYADLPKGYQISQHSTPICTGGYITITTKDKERKNIQLTRIHIEEDTGKSLHDQDVHYTLIDLNRAGVPLLEMVTEPVIANAGEAFRYLLELRRLVRYLEICDGNMEEGSLRCDANISVKLKGVKEFGTKVEVKNMNSMKNVQLAIEHEIARQVELIEQGGIINQETRSYNAEKGTTFLMRTKESADDYRYFPEPDLPPVIVTDDKVNKIKLALPPLPNELYNKYVHKYGLSEYDANVIMENKDFALYFEKLTSLTDNYKAAVNWMMGEVKSYLNKNALDIIAFPVKPEAIAELIQLTDSQKISFTAATQKILPVLLKEPALHPIEIAEKNNLLQDSDSAAIYGFIAEALAKYPDKVEEYKKGKKGLIGLFMGEVMRISKGNADPKLASRMLNEILNKQ